MARPLADEASHIKRFTAASDANGTNEEHFCLTIAEHLENIGAINRLMEGNRMLIATALTLALVGFVASMLARLARQDGPKIAAALQGRSWTASSPLPAARATLRISPRYTAVRPEPVRTMLRAAA